jgi:tetratricopeptide (TPR) repeat protein
MMAKLNEIRFTIQHAIEDVIDRFFPAGIFRRGDDNHRDAAKSLERGRRYYNKKQYLRSEDFFRRAATADDSYALAHYYLGLALYKMDKSEEAVKAWERAIHVGPGTKAAGKADKKIEYVKKHMNRTITELKEQIKSRQKNV